MKKKRRSDGATERRRVVDRILLVLRASICIPENMLASSITAGTIRSCIDDPIAPPLRRPVAPSLRRFRYRRFPHRRFSCPTP